LNISFQIFHFAGCHFHFFISHIVATISFAIFSPLLPAIADAIISAFQLS